MTNFVFSRRSMQEAIDRISAVLTEEQGKSLVARLNRLDDGRLPAMWELLVLDALSFVGALKHEICLPNGRRPDIELTLEAGSPDSAIKIVADVASVSDAGLDEQNPIKEFASEIRRLAVKFGLETGAFSWRVDGAADGPFRDRKMRLRLPPKAKLFALVRDEISPWMQSLQQARDETATFSKNSEDSAFEIKYHPGQLMSGGSYLSYDVAASLKKNPLYNALKAKARQLRDAPEYHPDHFCL